MFSQKCQETFIEAFYQTFSKRFITFFKKRFETIYIVLKMFVKTFSGMFHESCSATFFISKRFIIVVKTFKNSCK